MGTARLGCYDQMVPPDAEVVPGGGRSYLTRIWNSDNKADQDVTQLNRRSTGRIVWS